MRRRNLLLGAAAASVIPGSALGEVPAAGRTPWDVLIAGSGLAGLCAAATALESGARRVLVLEKGPVIGGHSAYSSGSLAVVIRKPHAGQKFDDSTETLLEDSKRVGGRVNEAIIRKVGDESESAADWLRSIGVPFSPVVFQAAGGIRPRCISTMGAGAGRAYVTAVNRRAKALGMKLRFGCALTGLVRKNGLWIARVNEKGAEREIEARTVVLATGGFTANEAMRSKYDPRLGPGMHTTANPHGLYFDGATGDGIRIGEALGAATAGLGNFQLLAYSGGRVLEYAGAEVYLDMKGHRFVNEAASTGELTAAILALPERSIWVVTDSRSVKGASLGLKLANGYVRKSETVAEMAHGMGLSPSALRKELDDFNAAARSRHDPRFGRTLFLQTVEQPPFYWGRETLNIHCSLGGLVTDTEARVLDRKGEPIEGLFAAGETTGVFGRDRPGGMALALCLVMGREAGRRAAKAAAKRAA